MRGEASASHATARRRRYRRQQSDTDTQGDRQPAKQASKQACMRAGGSARRLSARASHLLRQAARVVRGQRDLDAVVHVEPLGVVVRLLRQQRHARHEPPRLTAAAAAASERASRRQKDSRRRQLRSVGWWSAVCQQCRHMRARGGWAATLPEIAKDALLEDRVAIIVRLPEVRR